MTRSQIEKGILKSFQGQAETLGFTLTKSRYFVRMHKEWNDVFFVDLEQATLRSFCVIHGINVPSVSKQLLEISDPEVPSPFVARYLGQTKSGGVQKWYRFSDQKNLSKAAEQAWSDFELLGLPWLDSFQTLRGCYESQSVKF
jgi:hypothetical protein